MTWVVDTVIGNAIDTATSLLTWELGLLVAFFLGFSILIYVIVQVKRASGASRGA